MTWRWGWLGVAMALVTAGCVSPDRAAPEPGPDLAFSPPVQISDVRSPYGSAFEAFVAVDPTGDTVLACLHGMFKEPSLMFASLDRGTTWTELRADPSPYTGGDCEIEITDDGTWFFLHSTVAGATIVGTRDQGDTWTRSFLAAEPTNGMADRPWLDSFRNQLYLSFMPLQYTPGAIGFTQSPDGVDWSLTTWATSPSPDHSNVIQGHLTIHPTTGTLRIPFVSYTPVAYADAVADPVGAYSFAVSRDGGATWRTEPVPVPAQARVVEPPAAGYDGQGALYWAYSLDKDDQREVFVLRSTDEGATWSDPIAVATLNGGGPLWVDGRASGIDVLLQGDHPDFGAPGESDIIVARVEPVGDRVGVRLGWVAQGGGEFVCIDHDANGRASVAFVNGRMLNVAQER